ncbi:methionine ABC transporter permease [Necropsobacter rosorum]|uniref:methionine ABC transporter permease n=1 Tax=Necropsobacter rosorum TaxID=908285 RepID=UPI000509B4A4
MFDVLTPQMWKLLFQATLETLYMVFTSGFFAALFGIPLGIVVFITRKGQIKDNPVLNNILNVIVNVGRSVPFVILLVAIIPFTMLLIGTFIGTTAAIVPLTIAAIPFVARLIENALMEIPSGLTEAAQAMGATNFQIITKFLLPEALASIINAITITLVALVNYSAMAGTVGGGGLGYVGIQYGYQMYVPEILLATVVILVIMVQIIQMVGDRLVRTFNHK